MHYQSDFLFSYLVELQLPLGTFLFFVFVPKCWSSCNVERLAMKRLTSGAWRRLTDYYIAWESLMIGHHEGTITMRIFDVAGWRPPVIVSLFVVVNQS